MYIYGHVMSAYRHMIIHFRFLQRKTGIDGEEGLGA